MITDCFVATKLPQSTSGKGLRMPEDILCSCQHVTVKGKQENQLDDISLLVREKQIIALISEDESAGNVLKLMAGLHVPDGGRIAGSCMTKQERTRFPKKMQYVPDDIVCYDRLKVKEFLHGMANGGKEIGENAARLLSIFDIDENETLLEMTFEKNRLVAIIQAMMVEPELLLLNRPYNMLRKKTYYLLLKEIIQQYLGGTSLMIAAESYEEIVLPCNRYLFMENGKVTAEYDRSQLPKPAKVVTVWGGDISSFLPEKMKILIQTHRMVRFLYREFDMQKLACQVSKTGCDNFTIEELTMEEELFGHYERWLS